MNNYLQSDRHKKTTYIEELATLEVDERGAYTEKKDAMYTNCIQTVYTDKVSIDKNNIYCSSKPNESASNESKSASLDELEKNFALIYDLYPKKVGKAKAFARYKQWVSKSGRKVNGRTYHLTNKQIWKAVKKYVDELEAKDTNLQFYKGFDVLMGDSLLDYIEEGE